MTCRGFLRNALVPVGTLAPAVHSKEKALQGAKQMQIKIRVMIFPSHTVTNLKLIMPSAEGVRRLELLLSCMAGVTSLARRLGRIC